MKSFFFISGLCLATLSAQAKISREMVAVRACDLSEQKSGYGPLSLSFIEDIKIEDSGRSFTATLIHRNNASICAARYFMDYDGKEVECDECRDTTDSCGCIREECHPENDPGEFFKSQK